MMTPENFIEEGLYEKIKKIMLIPKVDVLIFNSDFSKTLLFKKINPPLQNNYFSMGGRMHGNESFSKCAVRKIKEEIGIIIDENSLVDSGVASETFLEKKKEYNFINIYFYVILEDDSKLILDSQHSQWKWFDVEDESLHKYLKKKIKGCIKKKNEKKR